MFASKVLEDVNLKRYKGTKTPYIFASILATKSTFRKVSEYVRYLRINLIKTLAKLLH